MTVTGLFGESLKKSFAFHPVMPMATGIQKALEVPDSGSRGLSPVCPESRRDFIAELRRRTRQVRSGKIGNALEDDKYRLC
jgi:hypothetical protein